MSLHPKAGTPAPKNVLANIPKLVAHYYQIKPDPAQAQQRVSFGTSGHRGNSLNGSFNELHILAISQAVANYRKKAGITGPLYMGLDTHALSEPAWISALCVLTANGVTLRVQPDVLTPTPLVSHAILEHNKHHAAQGSAQGLADGIVITPSHNPPNDGGFKYNPPSGGPADTEVTAVIQQEANELLEDLKNLPIQNLPSGTDKIQQLPLAEALKKAEVFDFITPYVEQLGQVIDLDAIRNAGIKIGVDPMGGSTLPVWLAIAERHDLPLEVVNTHVDPRFAFMTLDKDGAIRMDCSSPYAMASLLALKDDFDVAIGNDPDGDRHGIVTKDGLMNPNHYLAVMIDYLFRNRPNWPQNAGIGKTLVSSALIDRVAASLDRKLVEVPVGFKYFVEGLEQGTLGFGGEESAGASFLRTDGSAWSTDKDGIIAGLLAAEITAKTGKTPSQYYQELSAQHGQTAYSRTDAPATPEQKKRLGALSLDAVQAATLAGDAIVAKLTHAPGNEAKIGGLKVVTEHAWFAARPSGTENIYKIYAESFRGSEHLQTVIKEAEQVVAAALSDVVPS